NLEVCQQSFARTQSKKISGLAAVPATSRLKPQLRPLPTALFWRENQNNSLTLGDCWQIWYEIFSRELSSSDV
ncbi:MAG TPA: hypothetical protein PLT55_04395, partial [Acidimicrobiia bacterium]|nr:hypothetical protein [Acidimicrobiia bacterium]